MARGRHSSRLLIQILFAVVVALTELVLRTTKKLGVAHSYSPSFTAGRAANQGPLEAARSSRDRCRVTLYQQAGSIKTRNIFDLTQGLAINTSVPEELGGLASPTYADGAEFRETGDDRKLRSAIGSIATDQENLRMSTPLRTGKSVFAAATALMLAITASATATIPLWHQVLLPAVTSGLFLQTSVYETKGTKAKGLARHHSGQSVVLASQQKALLAQAEFRKAFLPFGVGLTAIFASACVALKLFNEKIGDLFPEDKINPPMLAADNFLMVFFAVASILGAMRTSETYLNMRSALTFKKEDQDTGAEKSKARWDLLQLPGKARDPSERERLLVNVLSLLACMLPLPFCINCAALTASEGGTFNKEFQEFIDSASVVISATAGAQSAIVCLVAELQFADVERRVAIQGRQAGLSELFFAQTQAEFAAMPAKSAWSGMMLALASLVVEFSAFASGISPWPAVLSSVKSFVSAKLTSSSADASWLERKVQGPVNAEEQNVLTSTAREISELLSSVTSTNEFSQSVRGSLKTLPVGGTIMFDALNGESRRKVHLLAAELGMVSQSIQEKRAVAVTNFGGAKIDSEETFAPAALAKVAQGALIETQRTVTGIAKRGIPAGEGPALVPALAATAAGVAANFTLGGTAAADFAVPLLTGGVGLTTVWQEQSGNGKVALAKEKVAKTKQQISKAESFLGRGTLSSSEMPTCLAVATAATTASVILFMEAIPQRLWWVSAVLLGITMGATMVAARRQKRAAFYMKQASRSVGGTPPPRSRVGRRHLWIAPLAIAVAMPCDLPRRTTIAMAILATEIAMMMSSTFTRAAAASFYIARAQRVYARAEVYASQADSLSCALPKNSAAAISTTLLAVVLSAFDTPAPLGSIFPLVGMGICLQAVQSRFLAGRNAKLAEIEISDIQRFGTDVPPFMQRAAQTEQLSTYIPSVKPVKYTSADVGLLDDVLPTMSADLQREDQSVDQLFEKLSVGGDEITWPRFRSFFLKFNGGKLTQQEIERLWLVFDKNMSGGVSRSELQAILGKPFKGRRRNGLMQTGSAVTKGAMYLLEETRADEWHRASAAEKAVESVQATLSELRLSVKSNEKDWLRTGVVVGTAATAAILAPFLLSEVLTEILLPVVGAALVLFAVDAEADSKIRIAKAKIWAAELTEIASTQEELLAIGGLYKARLISITALSVCVAITTIVIEEPFGIFELFPRFRFIQTVIRWGLIITQAVCSIWSMGRYLTVLEWTDRVNSRTSVTTSRNAFASEQEETPRSWFQGRREFGALDRRLPALMSVLPMLLLAIFPLGRHFGKRAVASTAAGAAVVALALYAAERAFARAEMSQAARMRTSALAEVFCEQAEQQGAILPFISAGTIAVAGVITFATELNPVFAAGLTLLQALGWVVASRKGVAAKFESEAALKVNLNTSAPRINPGKDPLKRIKRWMMT